MRVAFCIAGQLRDEDLSFPHVARFAREVGADIFVSTWRRRGSKTTGVIHGPQLGRMFGEDFTRLFPASIVAARFTAAFPEFEAEVSQRFATVTDAQIRSHFPKAVIDIEDEDLCLDFDEPVGDNNSLRMLYKAWRCNELKRAAEKRNGAKYDLVARFRPDVVPLLSCEQLALIHEQDDGTTVWTPQGGSPNFAQDLYAISNSPAMDHYCSLFGKALQSPGRPWQIIHHELYHHLTGHGLSIKSSKTVQGPTENSPERRRVNIAILTDLIRAGRVSEAPGITLERWRSILPLMELLAAQDAGADLSYDDLNAAVDNAASRFDHIPREAFAAYRACAAARKDARGVFAFGLLYLIFDLHQGGRQRIQHVDVILFIIAVHRHGLDILPGNPLSPEGLRIAGEIAAELAGPRFKSILTSKMFAQATAVALPQLEEHSHGIDLLCMRFDHDLHTKQDRAAAEQVLADMTARYPQDWRWEDRQSHLHTAAGRIEEGLEATQRAPGHEPGQWRPAHALRSPPASPRPTRRRDRGLPRGDPALAPRTALVRPDRGPDRPQTDRRRHRSRCRPDPQLPRPARYRAEGRQTPAGRLTVGPEGCQTCAEPTTHPGR
jgi:hypothetical protein